MESCKESVYYISCQYMKKTRNELRLIECKLVGFICAGKIKCLWRHAKSSTKARRDRGRKQELCQYARLNLTCPVKHVTEQQSCVCNDVSILFLSRWGIRRDQKPILFPCKMRKYNSYNTNLLANIPGKNQIQRSTDHKGVRGHSAISQSNISILLSVTLV